MAQVLQEINFKYAIVYVADILIHSANVDEHLMHIQNVFGKVNEANKKQPKKSQFAAKSIEYLGHFFLPVGLLVNSNTIQVKPFLYLKQ